jgi:hypothetical protein
VGAAGAGGAKGDKGDTGAQGLVGAKGDKGDTGAAGASGAAGVGGAKGDKGDKGDTGAQGLVGAKGDKGDTGATGSAGPVGPSAADLLYGDGSAGACVNCGNVVTSSTLGVGRMYSSITLNHDTMVEYPHTLTLRSTGTVNITARALKIRPGYAGSTTPPAGYGAGSASRGGGGKTIYDTNFERELSVAFGAAKWAHISGSAGAGESGKDFGGQGGGGLRILAKGAITIDGSEILAMGGAGTKSRATFVAGGAGGGSGGVIVLVSDTSITFNRTVFGLGGGNGADGTGFALAVAAGAGGGGAGGCVILIAPVINGTPALIASGGAVGIDDIQIGFDLRYGFGGGGNACANGGDGGMITGGTISGINQPGNNNATFGDAGRIIKIATGSLKPSVLLAAY